MIINLFKIQLFQLHRVVHLVEDNLLLTFK